MNDDLANNGQFKMRMDDDMDEHVIPTQVDELRIEKLSTRVTIISIIIPVLIVVVLAFAYLDIKKRVTRTEDTGTTGVENLSKEMESRFSSLSVRQASLEESIKKMDANNNKSLARVQVKLKKLDDTIQKLRKNMVDDTTLEGKIKELKQEIGNVAQSLENNQSMAGEITQKLKDQMEQISANDTQNQIQISQIDTKLAELKRDKIDQSALDLAIKLEILKLKKSYSAQLDNIQEHIRQLEKSPGKPSVPKTPKPKPSQTTSGGTPTPSTTQQAPNDKIVEQEIGE